MPDMQITYAVSGMSCDHCKAAVEHEVGRVAGVVSVTADVASGRVVVRGERLEDGALRAAIDEAGYQAAPSK